MNDLHLLKNRGTVIGDQNFALGSLDLKQKWS